MSNSPRLGELHITQRVVEEVIWEVHKIHLMYEKKSPTDLR